MRAPARARLARLPAVPRLPSSPLLCLLFCLPLALAAQQPVQPADLGDLDIEQLTRIRVTSVARRPEALGQAPAAIFVITRDDIRRSGAVSLPEALRLAPGLEVARVSSRDWAISARGFNERSSNKLLVLIDGRAVYSPVFAGVHWDVQDVPIADVERIEVILGPGATLWGSNAVNGVINIVTHSAFDTPGGLATLNVGTGTRVAATLRQTVRFSPAAAARVFARYLDFAPTDLPGGGEASDDWRLGHAGFRFDAWASPKDRVVVEADGYRGTGAEPLLLPMPTAPFTGRVDEDLDVHGGSVLGRWSRHFSDASQLRVQAYADHFVRKEPAFLGRMRVNRIDLDVQQQFVLDRHQNVMVGAGYRRDADEVTGAYVVRLVPPSRATDLVTAFLQDDITLGRIWRLTAGSKFEHNAFSGWEIQPNVRLRWVPGARQLVWAAVSRAVRIPSRIDVDLDEVGRVLPGTPPTLIRAVGNDAFEAERLIAYELGYRAMPIAALALDVDLHYNDYDRLRTFNPLPATTEDSFTVIPLTLGNDAHGRSYGGTAALNWQPLPRLRAAASYTYLHMRIATTAGVFGATSDTRPDFNPAHQASARAVFTVSDVVELDGAVRYVSSIFGVPDYLQGDVRLGWRPRPALELAIVGKDLFAARHLEFASPSFAAENHAIPRRGLLQVRWRF